MTAPENWAVAAVEALPSGLLLLDADGRVLEANASAARILGRSNAELRGARVDTLLVDLERLRSIERDRASQRALAVGLPDGRAITVGFSIAPAQEGFVLIFQDISERLASDRERERLTQRAVVADFLPSLLHELRNPLAGMTNALELLFEEAADPSVARDLSQILREARRLDLAFQGFAIAGRELYGNDRIQVSGVIRDSLSLLAPLAREARVEIRTDLPELPRLPLDEKAIRGLIFNMVAHGLSRCAAGDHILLSASVDEKNLTLSMLHSGRPDDVSLVDTAPDGRARRVGVGLLLCKRAVETVGGRIAIEERGVERTFRLTLPRGDHPRGSLAAADHDPGFFPRR